MIRIRRGRRHIFRGETWWRWCDAGPGGGQFPCSITEEEYRAPELAVLRAEVCKNCVRALEAAERRAS